MCFSRRSFQCLLKCFYVFNSSYFFHCHCQDFAGEIHSKGAKEITEPKNTAKWIATEDQDKAKIGKVQQTIQSQPLWKRKSLQMPREQVRKLKKEDILNLNKKKPITISL